MIEIKRDIDGYVVYVDGRVHPKGTGFQTRAEAKKWARAEGLLPPLGELGQPDFICRRPR